MREPSDAVRAEPEPYESEGPRWVVIHAEAELIARYGGLDNGELGLTAVMFEPPAGSFLVARAPDGAHGVSGPPLGGVGLRRVAEGVGEVRRLWVDPPWRGRGVAQALMAGLEDAAGNLGLKELVLATGNRQPEAVRLYQGLGWERTYVDADGHPLPVGYIRFVKAISRGSAPE